MTHRLSRSRALLSVLLLCTLVAAPAWAERTKDRWRDAGPQGFAPAQSADKRITLDDATRRASRHVRGRVLNARERGDIYEVKVLTPDNEVVTVTVDARSGEIIR